MNDMKASQGSQSQPNQQRRRRIAAIYLSDALPILKSISTRTVRARENHCEFEESPAGILVTHRPPKSIPTATDIVHYYRVPHGGCIVEFSPED